MPSKTRKDGADQLNMIFNAIAKIHMAVQEQKTSPLSLTHISPEQPFHNAMHSPQEHTALSINVTPVLAFQCGACKIKTESPHCHKNALI